MLDGELQRSTIQENALRALGLLNQQVHPDRFIRVPAGQDVYWNIIKSQYGVSLNRPIEEREESEGIKLRVYPTLHSDIQLEIKVDER